MNLEDVQPRMRVAYVPQHANNSLEHPDVEFGVVSSKNHVNVFVKFDKQLHAFGWEGTTSQACCPEDLVLIHTQP